MPEIDGDLGRNTTQPHGDPLDVRSGSELQSFTSWCFCLSSQSSSSCLLMRMALPIRILGIPPVW
jgi:hypothetical protein